MILLLQVVKFIFQQVFPLKVLKSDRFALILRYEQLKTRLKMLKKGFGKPFLWLKVFGKIRTSLPI